MIVGKAMVLINLVYKILFIALILPVALLPFSAWAHIKWFAPYDLSKPPLPIGNVLNTTFIYLYLLSIFCIYLFFFIDRYFYWKRFLTNQLSRYTVNDNQSFWILRISVSVFFFSLFLFGVFGHGFLLTPELSTSNSLVHWLQLLLAGFALYRPTAPLVGVGILLLYGIGLWHYGTFHMLDYLVFLGVAVYFLLSGLKDRKWITTRYVTLFATTGLSLLWGAIEKWAYPHWTYPLLEKDPALLMGMEQSFYMILAGFVEFNITFILLSSASIFSRVIALVFQCIFILAIYIFGLIDAVGHLLIIAILFILVVRGPTTAREFLVLPDKSLWTEAYFMTGLYVLAINVMFMSYYGLYSLTH